MEIRSCSFFAPTPAAHTVNPAEMCLLKARSAAGTALGLETQSQACSTLPSGRLELVQGCAGVGDLAISGNSSF